jgi:uncharacterized protein (TIGR03083 family)
MAAVAGHRRRWGAAVSSLNGDELTAPSRCAGWTVADLLRHGVWADGAMRLIWKGDTAMSRGFDPRSTPDQFVQAQRAVPDEEVRRQYLASSEAMVAELEAAGPERFAAPSWSPLGRVPWWFSALHLGWDSAVHERDALAPLGRPLEATSGEPTLLLAYSLVLVSFFAGPEPLDARVGPVRVRMGDGPVTAWPVASGADGVDPRDPDDAPAVGAGDTMAIVDGLTGRARLADVLDGPPDLVERLDGLATYFTAPV